MRHRVSGYKLSRDSEHRRAMFRNLAVALFQHGQITTTLPKAKAVQPFVEKLVTLARKGDLASRRRVIAELQDREQFFVHNGGKNPDQDVEIAERTIVQKLFEEIGPKYADRPGGYSRIVKLTRHRLGDGSDLVVLQLVGDEEDGAPRVRGRYSRRRQQQNNRTTYAAKLRKQAPGESVVEDDAIDAATDVPVDDTPAEAPPATQADAAMDAPKAEAAADEPQAPAADDAPADEDTKNTDG